MNFMKTQYTRTEITDILLKNGFKPCVTKESDVYDIYEKKGVSKVRLLANTKIFQKTLLLQILPKELHALLN